VLQYGIIRADLPALKAGGAGVLIENQFGRRFVGLGVLTPAADQRAAFKKNGGADSRAVMKGKPLNVENQGLIC
jgi:hypothetical protein